MANNSKDVINNHICLFNCVCIKTNDKDRYNDFETLEIRPRLCSKAEVVKALFQIISCSAIEREKVQVEVGVRSLSGADLDIGAVVH